MPGIPLVPRQTSSYSRSTVQMSGEDGHLSAEEKMAAEESFNNFCRPVELYNIIQRRAISNPSFLQRSLQYKIEAKHEKRIQMTISLPGTANAGVDRQRIFPLYVIVARLIPSNSVLEYAAAYRFIRACNMTSFSGTNGGTQAQAIFILPEINRLSIEAKSGSLSILFLSFAGTPNPEIGMNSTKSYPGNRGGYSLWGKIALKELYTSWEKSPNMSFGQRIELMPSVNMAPCFLKLSNSKEGQWVSIEVPSNIAKNAPQQIQVSICAEEVGAEEKSPYYTYACNYLSSSTVPDILRMRHGNVMFHYRYYDNKLVKTEATEEFTCPFCVVKCASLKGLQHHLTSSHDLFDYNFLVTDEYQAVIVSLKTETDRAEIVAAGVDPQQQTFCFCSDNWKRKRKNRIRNATQSDDVLSSRGEKAHRSAENIISPECLQGLPPSSDIAGILDVAAQPNVDPTHVQSEAGTSLAHTTVLQFAKTRKLSAERSDPRNNKLLQRRQFFHSHRAQPMAFDQVLSERDSEDEVDDDVADFEDRRLLDDFVDVTKDEKHMMHMWNSFVRKQRVLADGHIPWACEAFSGIHGLEIAQSPSLSWCWKLIMIKLWNHGLLDARSINTCNSIIDKFMKL